MKLPDSFTLLVKTNMPKTELLGYDTQKKAYVMHVHAAPEKGKANMEIVKFFKKQKLDIRIISGLSSRKKLVKIPKNL